MVGAHCSFLNFKETFSEHSGSLKPGGPMELLIRTIPSLLPTASAAQYKYPNSNVATMASDGEGLLPTASAAQNKYPNSNLATMASDGEGLLPTASAAQSKIPNSNVATMASDGEGLLPTASAAQSKIPNSNLATMASDGEGLLPTASAAQYKYPNSNMAIMASDGEELERQNRGKKRKNQERETNILDGFEALLSDAKRLKEDVPDMSRALDGHVKILYEIADAMDHDLKAATVVGVTGAGLSVAGGLLALSGAALAPFTGGASLVASVGVGGSFLGGFTKVAGSVKAKWDTEKSEKEVEDVLMLCSQLLETLKASYDEVQKKILELEGEEMKERFREALRRMKLMFSQFDPALNTEAFTLVLRSITLLLTARLLSRVVVEKVSQEVSQAVTIEIVMVVARNMTKTTTSFLSFEAIKDFLTFSVKEVKWYQQAARTSAVASGVAATVFLPFDAIDLYREADRLSKGTKSEIAEEIRNVARQLEDLIRKLLSGLQPPGNNRERPVVAPCA